jgi:hypothetical protein
LNLGVGAINVPSKVIRDNTNNFDITMSALGGTGKIVHTSAGINVNVGVSGGSGTGTAPNAIQRNEQLELSFEKGVKDLWVQTGSTTAGLNRVYSLYGATGNLLQTLTFNSFVAAGGSPNGEVWWNNLALASADPIFKLVMSIVPTSNAANGFTVKRIHYDLAPEAVSAVPLPAAGGLLGGGMLLLGLLGRRKRARA